MLMYQSLQGVEKTPFPANEYDFEKNEFSYEDFYIALGKFLVKTYPKQVLFLRTKICLFIGDITYKDEHRNYEHVCTDFALEFFVLSKGSSVGCIRFSCDIGEYLEGFIHPQISACLKVKITGRESNEFCMGNHLEHVNLFRKWNDTKKEIYIKMYVNFYLDYITKVGLNPYYRSVPKAEPLKFVTEDEVIIENKNFIKLLVSTERLEEFLKDVNFNFVNSKINTDKNSLKKAIEKYNEILGFSPENCLYIKKAYKKGSIEFDGLTFNENGIGIYRIQNCIASLYVNMNNLNNKEEEDYQPSYLFDHVLNLL